MTRAVCLLAVAAVSSIAMLSVSLGQAPNQQSAPPSYRPGLGDLMTMTVQPRHLKLGIAALERNWPYAAYEHHQLEEAFDRVARSWPQWRKFPIADMMAVIKEPMAALSEAIKKTDANGYNAAYRQLTDGCNSCHQSTNVGVNAIVIPNASVFPNQDFRAAKP